MTGPIEESPFRFITTARGAEQPLRLISARTGKVVPGCVAEKYVIVSYSSNHQNKEFWCSSQQQLPSYKMGEWQVKSLEKDKFDGVRTAVLFLSTKAKVKSKYCGDLGQNVKKALKGTEEWKDSGEWKLNDDHDVFFWMDCLCIHGDSEFELEYEFRRLGVLYKRAEATLACPCFEKKYKPDIKPLPGWAKVKKDPLTGGIKPIKDSFWPMDDDVVPRHELPVDLPPWYKRVWTLQEALLSRKLFAYIPCDVPHILDKYKFGLWTLNQYIDKRSTSGDNSTKTANLIVATTLKGLDVSLADCLRLVGWREARRLEDYVYGCAEVVSVCQFKPEYGIGIMGAMERAGWLKFPWIMAQLLIVDSYDVENFVPGTLTCWPALHLDNRKAFGCNVKELLSWPWAIDRNCGNVVFFRHTPCFSREECELLSSTDGYYRAWISKKKKARALEIGFPTDASQGANSRIPANVHQLPADGASPNSHAVHLLVQQHTESCPQGIHKKVGVAVVRRNTSAKRVNLHVV